MQYIKPSSILSMTVRQSTENDKKLLKPYDNTRLVAVTTCPTWGVMRYGLNLRMPSAGEAMPLLAGSVAHEVIAAARVYSLIERDLHLHAATAGIRLFGEERFNHMYEQIQKGEDTIQNRLRFSLEAFYSSRFAEDPRDKRRTTANLEEAFLVFLNMYDHTREVYIEDENDPTKYIGIETPFDLVVTIEIKDHVVPFMRRFIGKIDGIVVTPRGRQLEVDEYKTASRIDEAWEASFEMSHQVTGYLLAASSIIKEPLDRGKVWGIQIPQPRGYISGFAEIPFKRTPHMYREWFAWFYNAVMLYDAFDDDPSSAPKFTHSCNRYFRPCSLIPYCTAPPDERKAMLPEFEYNEWNPLHEEN